MNRKMVSNLLGIVLFSQAALMLLPLGVAVYYHESIMCFVITIGALLFGGLVLTRFKPKSKTIYSREGFMVVSFGWILMSMFGALPFFLSGEIPNYIDALFEAVSGFTTTGASILTNVEAMSKSLVFWRSFTHWIGGMGVLVFVMAVLPLAGGGGNIFLMRAESPGPDVGKLVPKSNSTARILYGIYLFMTVAEIILLKCGGESFFDSVTLSFGTAGTGGFGIRNDSITGYSTYTQIVIGIFMALFGINFNIYFLLLCGKIKDVLKNEELRAYLAIMGTAILCITLDIKGSFDSVWQALHTAAFQVSSVMTTTGYSTADFDKWPELSRMIMIAVMFVGGCAGSTGGGIKVARILLMLKNIKKEFKRLIHPRSVNIIRFDGKRVSDEVAQSTSVYLTVYMIIFVFSILLVSLDNFDMTSNVTAVVATLNNIGPGLGIVGATGSFAPYSMFSKMVFVIDMLLGRLEIFPLLLIFISGARSKKSA